MTGVNYWAVFVSGIASMIIGSIWYGPLFGKLFMREMGMDTMSKEKKQEMKKGMWMNYLGQFIASLVMLYVLAGLIVGFDKASVGGGMQTALLVWVGFVVPIKLGDALWGGNKAMFWLAIGNMLLTFLAGGAIIGAWK